MNKKYLYLLITFIVILFFYFKNNIISNTLFILNETKLYLFNKIDNIEFSISTHFNQSEKIKQLTKENKEYRDYISKIQPILINYTKLKNFKYIKNPKIIFTQTISYAKLPDITSIYIDYSEKNLSTPRGLIYNNIAAGIVIKSIKDFSLAYLNNNQNTSYTIFIGKNKIPGVLFGGKKIIIKYIPKYKKIKLNDIVITSGLDKIFYEGIKVGKITSIKQKELYQEAIIKPFYNPLHPSLFYIVKN